MSFATRRDFGVRVAIEKGQKPDEAMARSQFLPGRNITFEWMANYDLKIHADTIGGGAGSSIRMFAGLITLSLIPISGSSRGYDHNSLESGLGAATSRFHYGQAKFIDVVHNWELSDAQGFDYSIYRTWEGIIAPAGLPLPKDHVKVIGIDENTVRIWGTEIGTLLAEDWAANSDTILFDNGGGNTMFPDFRKTPVQYFIVLHEKVPHEIEIGTV